MLETALKEIQERNSRPKQKVQQHAKASQGTLQMVMSQPYVPPCLVYERPVAPQKGEGKRAGEVVLARPESADPSEQVQRMLALNQKQREQ